MNKIIVIGSSNIDLIMKMDHLPQKGETVTDAKFMQVYGGKGANQAVAAARAGGNVTFVNCVGDDLYTPKMIKNFQQDGINTSCIFRETGVASGHALVMIGDQGNNYLSVAPGANYRLTPAKIDSILPEISQATILVIQYEIPEETLKHIIGVANGLQIPLLFNFAPARPLDLSLIEKINILVLNVTEAEFLTHFLIRNKLDAETAATSLVNKGVELVIITLGENGVVAVSQHMKFYVPAFQVEAIDTTAAGDTFCGSFTVAWTEGKSLEESLLFASAASAISVTKMGAQPSIPFRSEIDRFIPISKPTTFFS